MQQLVGIVENLLWLVKLAIALRLLFARLIKLLLQVFDLLKAAVEFIALVFGLRQEPLFLRFTASKLLAQLGILLLLLTPLVVPVLNLVLVFGLLPGLPSFVTYRHAGLDARVFSSGKRCDESESGWSRGCESKDCLVRGSAGDGGCVWYEGGREGEMVMLGIAGTLIATMASDNSSHK